VKTVLVHGLGQGADAWERTVAALPAESHVHCPEIFANTSGDEPLTYDRLYRSFTQYCDDLDGRLNLCGLSLGGLLALNYTIDHPDKVKSLSLIGTPSRIPAALFGLQNLVFRILPNAVFTKMGLPKNQILQLTKSMTALDFEDQLPDVSCPTLVLCGSKDAANKKSAKILAKEIPLGRVTWIEGAGHEANVDQPSQLGEVLTAFLGGLCTLQE